MQEIEKFLKRIKSDSVTERCWAATCGSHLEDGSRLVTNALISLLEDTEWCKGRGDMTHSLCVGRAATSLAHAFQRLPDERKEMEERIVSILQLHTKSDDEQIMGHAKHALTILQEEPQSK